MWGSGRDDHEDRVQLAAEPLDVALVLTMALLELAVVAVGQACRWQLWLRCGARAAGLLLPSPGLDGRAAAPMGDLAQVFFLLSPLGRRPLRFN